jgi:hypothetical protein
MPADQPLVERLRDHPLLKSRFDCATSRLMREALAEIERLTARGDAKAAHIADLLYQVTNERDLLLVRVADLEEQRDEYAALAASRDD